jgi:hypothetical protein
MSYIAVESGDVYTVPNLTDLTVKVEVIGHRWTGSRSSAGVDLTLEQAEELLDNLTRIVLELQDATRIREDEVLEDDYMSNMIEPAYSFFESVSTMFDRYHGRA